MSLSVSTWSSSLPIAWRLYLPEVWCQDAERCRQAGVPEEIEFQTKPEIALEQIRQAMEQKVPAGVVLADAGYGNGTQFRDGHHPTRTAICSGHRVYRPPSGNRDNNPCRRRRENQVGVRPPNACSAMRTISPFR